MNQWVWWQYCLPQRLLSSVMGKLAGCRCKRLKNFAIRRFISHFKVDMREAQIEDYQQYTDFNDFFIRKLKSGVRSQSEGENSVTSPVDATVSAVGSIKEQHIFQAKGKLYSLLSLLGGDKTLADQFAGGEFLTAYLSPRDYHRIHMPCNARLLSMTYIPGKLFSVNEASVAKIDELFARNERVICSFESDSGLFVMIAVGAMIVGSIATAWHGVVNSPRLHATRHWSYTDKEIKLEKGDEFGYFKLGSTVILLFSENEVNWDSSLKNGSALKVGQLIASS